MLASPYSASLWSSFISETSFSHNRSAYCLDSNNTFSFFSSVYNDSIAYYSWDLNLDFTLGENNVYSSTLDKVMSKKSFSTNIPIERNYLSGLRSSLNDYLMLSNTFNYIPEKEDYELYYPTDFPYEKLAVNLKGYEPIDFSYEFIVDSINEVPSFINLPTGELSGNYNEVTKTFENIHYSGSNDRVTARWICDSDNIVYFSYYAPNDVTSISIPDIYNNIADSLDIEYENLNPYSLQITDYDTCTNTDQIHNISFKVENNIRHYYSSRYYQYIYFTEENDRTDVFESLLYYE